MLIFQKIYLAKICFSDKSLISNGSEYYETLESCVLCDDFCNSVDDQPKEPLVETLNLKMYQLLM